MKKGQIAEGVIERVDFPNKGVFAAEDGSRVVVKNTIPGQRVSVRILKARKGVCEGQLLEVLERSPSEQSVPGCVHAGVCGGCVYQTLSYEDQLQLKTDQVKRLLDGVIRPEDKDYEFAGAKESPCRYGYRNKMEYSFGDAYKDGPLALGLHRRGSFYDIVNVPDCKIVDPDFGTVLSVTLSYFTERGISYYHKMRHTGYLRHLLVRRAAKTGEILIDLVTTTEEPEAVRPNEASFGAESIGAGREAKTGEILIDLVTTTEESEAVRPNEASFGAESSGTGREETEKELLAGWVKALLAAEYTGTITGILHTANDRVADVIADEGTTVLYGRDYFYEELLGLRFLITPFSFFQTNSCGAEVLYETAREFIGDAISGEKTVFDLYSGTGTIAQVLSAAAGKVTGVEIVEEAVEAARENAKRNHLTNCEFIAGDVLKVLDSIEECPDFIVLDPPRDGVHPKALAKIIRYGVDQMVYISCKPSSLARDLVTLQAGGYRVKKAACVDMFPFTANIEVVVLMQRCEADKMQKV